MKFFAFSVEYDARMIYTVHNTCARLECGVNYSTNKSEKADLNPPLLSGGLFVSFQQCLRNS